MRINGGIDILWLSAMFVDVDGSAKPGSYEYKDHGTNDVATIRLADQINGDALLISGYPDSLLRVAQEILRVCQLVQIQANDAAQP